ncbi:CLCA_X family protein [Marinobacter sp.]|uniref:CLCA_X family protein n=1 Tax=Marinobacter sp. TaxID=50741 RepID=UPI0038502BE8
MMSQAVSFVAVRRQFEFRSIEIGRWVSEPERDRAAIRFSKALNDLMAVLRGTEALISLRQTLGLQFGIGGRPGVAAHYMPATRQLALAKNAGAGSLAHEWFHAFDHYMGARAFMQTAPFQFASSAWLDGKAMKSHSLNARLAECLKIILLSEDGTAPSELFRNSTRADRGLGTLYYARPEELCARAFEAFVEDALPDSHFLVRGTRHSREAVEGLYPTGEHRQAISRAFSDYFASLGAALHRQKARTG